MVAILGFLFAPGCGRRKKEAEELPPSETTAQAEIDESQAGQAPELGLSVNNQRAATVYQGWPVQIDLEVRHPKVFVEDEKVDPMVVSSRGESWAEAVRLEMRDAQDRAIDAAFLPVPRPEKTLVLDAGHLGALRWWLDGEKTKFLPEGEYNFVAFLETAKSEPPGAWHGQARSGRVLIRVQQEPTSLNEVQKEERRLLAAGIAEAQGDRKKAQAEIEALLRERPESIAGLVRKSDLLEKAGNKAEALDALEKALDIIRRDHPEAEFLEDIQSRYQRLTSEILKD